MARVHEMRVVVGTSDCDALGHMNVSRYFDFSSRNGREMQAAMGRTPGEVGADGLRLSFAVVKAESEFLAEVMEGEVLVVRADVVRIGTKSAAFRNRIAREDGTEVFRSVWHSACLNLDTRRAEVIPADWRAALEAFLDDG